MKNKKPIDENQRIYRDSIISATMKKLVIAIFDFVVFAVINGAICYLTQNGHLATTDYGRYILFDYVHFLSIGLIAVFVNYLFKLYQSVWNYAGIDEMIRCILSSAVNSAILFFVDRVIYIGLLDGYENARLGYYAYFILFVLEAVALIAPRLGIRFLKTAQVSFTSRAKSTDKRVMIVGAGFMGNFIIDSLRVNSYRHGKPVIAIDDNPAKLGKRINNVKVVGNCSKIAEMAEKYNIDEIIVCIPSASNARQKEVINLAMSTGATVKISPSVEDMIENGGNKQSRKVEITDLLSRPEVKLDKKVCRYLIDKTILVTGGGGSIGSEICMQVARYNPNTIVVFDIYENCAFELANELNNKYGDEIDIQVRIGSVRDMGRLREVFNEFHPDVVFHAAAHKHVPLMEDSPCEAVKNNVFGTYNLAKTADKYGVKRFVMISTDKAVNPTNVMGATKRVCEMIVQSKSDRSHVVL